MIGAILAGGENSRMPVLKGFLVVDGKPIIERGLEVLARVFGKVVISTNMPERYFYLGAPLIGDVVSGGGPVTGILSVLTATGEDAVFVAACDMPFISEELVRYMADVYGKRSSESKGEGHVGAVIPEWGGRMEPLFGIYSRAALGTLETMVRAGKRSLQEVLRFLNTHLVSEEEVKAVDPEGRSFANINTVEDYERIGGKSCLV